MHFPFLADKQSENKRKRKNRLILGPIPRTKNTVEHEGDGDMNCGWCSWNCFELTGIVGSWWKNPDHLDYNILDIIQNTEKSPQETYYPSEFSESLPANIGEKILQEVMIFFKRWMFRK